MLKRRGRWGATLVTRETVGWDGMGCALLGMGVGLRESAMSVGNGWSPTPYHPRWGRPHLMAAPDVNVQKQREVEAINGAFAALGLTAGVIVEGASGKGILEQVRLSILLL